jgi:tetratricopeptide (TPR) repeat protein
MRAYEATGGLLYWRGLFDRAETAYTKALEIATQHGGDAEVANAAYNLSFIYGIPRTDVPRALQLLRTAREKWNAVGDRAGAARASWALAAQIYMGKPGMVPIEQLKEALAAATEALAVHREGTNRFDVGWDLHIVGMVNLKLGEFHKAMKAFREAASIFGDVNDLSGLALIASNTAVLASVRAMPERQAILVGFADAVAERAGTGLLPNLKVQDGRALPEDIPPELQPAVERGRAMDVAAGMAYALSEDALA